MFEWMFSWAIPALALAEKHDPTSTRCFGKQCAKGKPISLELETFTVLCYGWTKQKQMQMMITVTLLCSSFQEGCVVWRLISSSFCNKHVNMFFLVVVAATAGVFVWVFPDGLIRCQAQAIPPLSWIVGVAGFILICSIHNTPIDCSQS